MKHHSDLIAFEHILSQNTFFFTATLEYVAK